MVIATVSDVTLVMVVAISTAIGAGVGGVISPPGDLLEAACRSI